MEMLVGRRRFRIQFIDFSGSLLLLISGAGVRRGRSQWRDERQYRFWAFRRDPKPSLMEGAPF
jgi:hypothetical protein